MTAYIVQAGSTAVVKSRQGEHQEGRVDKDIRFEWEAFRRKYTRDDGRRVYFEFTLNAEFTIIVAEERVIEIGRSSLASVLLASDPSVAWLGTRRRGSLGNAC